jgi:ABC-type multidrug transport system ATPase subunit
MADKPLGSFVSGALAKGMSKQDLRSVLMKGGWPKEIIESYLSKVIAGQPVVRSPILRCKGIGKKGGSGSILENIDLEIAKGEIFGIVGLGGSGKSTLMNVLVGLLPPDAGDVQVIDNGIARSVFRDDVAREMIGFSSQVPSFFDDLTARENVMHFAALYDLAESAQKAAASSLLRLVSIDKQADQLASSLSVGQRKHLDLACALVHGPRVLFLDDPAAELDLSQQRELWRILRDIASKGTTIVIASNFLADLESLCDRLGILRNGRIAEVGKPDDLRAIYSHDFEVRLRTEKQLYAQISSALASDSQSAAKKISKEGDHLLVFTPSPQATLRSLLVAIDKQGDAIVSVELMRPTIQEVFESLSR